jgi:MarR family transcriptional regulator, organic hydroperoxide resistance regulator
MATSTGDRRPTTGSLIWHLSLKWRGAVDRALAPLGLTHAQYVLLASLYGLLHTGARPSQRELADFSGLDPMYVSKLARALEDAGLLARETNAADPRAFHLTITGRGGEVLSAAYARVRELQERLLAPLGGPGDARRVQLTESLQTLLRYVEGLDDSVPVTPSTSEE